jgi:hypothetical protein
MNANCEQTKAFCNMGCVFAESLPNLNGEWIWCTQPVSETRLCSELNECSRFVLAAGQRNKPAEPSNRSARE